MNLNDYLQLPDDEKKSYTGHVEIFNQAETHRLDVTANTFPLHKLTAGSVYVEDLPNPGDGMVINTDERTVEVGKTYLLQDGTVFKKEHADMPPPASPILGRGIFYISSHVEPQREDIEAANLFAQRHLCTTVNLAGRKFMVEPHRDKDSVALEERPEDGANPATLEMKSYVFLRLFKNGFITA
jgi:hypothetical protein